jgi:hypothetical protein
VEKGVCMAEAEKTAEAEKAGGKSFFVQEQ